jgi:hypothetical protein
VSDQRRAEMCFRRALNIADSSASSEASHRSRERVEIYIRRESREREREIERRGMYNQMRLVFLQIFKRKKLYKLKKL